MVMKRGRNQGLLSEANFQEGNKSDKTNRARSLFCDSCTMHGNVTVPFLLVFSLVRNKQLFFVC